MNILHVLSQHEVTGAETYAAVLADNQVGAGHNVWIVSDTFRIRTAAQVQSLPIGKRDFLQRLSNISTLRHIIRDNHIDVVHAHSRAASWVSFFATRGGNVPLVSTLHGRQHAHLSSRVFRIYGEMIMAVCEDIRDHLVRELNYPPDSVSVVRNGIDIPKWRSEGESQPDPAANIISLVGRLSGPKGILAERIVREVLPEALRMRPDIELHIVGHMNDSARFLELVAMMNQRLGGEKVKIIGFVENVKEVYRRSNLIIGSGRVAMEALATGAKVIAVGESNYLGVISKTTTTGALETNFGDAGVQQAFDALRMTADITAALSVVHGHDVEFGQNIICKEYDINKISQKVMETYAEAGAIKRGVKEIPVLLFHRVTKGVPVGTRHGIYVTELEFEKQLAFLKRRGYTTLTFTGLKQILEGKQKMPARPVMLTFDDGYEDNALNAFPILRKFSFTAVIFLIGNRTIKTNEWDVKDGEPELNLLNDDQVKTMDAYGIEFGAHSFTHKNLTEIPLLDAEKEIYKSKTAVAERVRKPVISFAYPYGKANEDVKRIVHDAGFSFGIASDSGPRNISKDFYEVRRIQIFPGAPWLSFWKKTSGWYHKYKRIV